MALINNQPSGHQIGCESYQSTICVNTPIINMELNDDLEIEKLQNSGVRNGFSGETGIEIDLQDQQHELQQRSLGSPTRISSSNDIMRLDNILYNNREKNTMIGGCGGYSNQGIHLFSEKLIGQIIEKAEVGRVIMGIDDI